MHEKKYETIQSEKTMKSMYCGRCGEIILIRSDWDFEDIAKAAQEQCETECDHYFLFKTFPEIKREIRCEIKRNTVNTDVRQLPENHFRDLLVSLHKMPLEDLVEYGHNLNKRSN